MSNIELGTTAEGAGLRISEEVTITGITFSKDANAMKTRNWEKSETKQNVYLMLGQAVD
jgi:hypothetical protein